MWPHARAAHQSYMGPYQTQWSEEPNRRGREDTPFQVGVCQSWSKQNLFEIFLFHSTNKPLPFEFRKDESVLEQVGSEHVRRLIENLNCMVGKGAVGTTVKTGEIDDKKEEYALFEV